TGALRYNSETPGVEFCLGATSTWTSFAAAGGGSALNSLTDATNTNTIDSDDFAQVWNWSTLDTETALKLSGSAVTSGTLLHVHAGNAAAVASAAVTVTNATTGIGAGVISTMTGANNNSAAFYGVNS